MVRIDIDEELLNTLNINEEVIKFLLKQFEKTEVLKIFVKLLTMYELVKKFIS